MAVVRIRHEAVQKENYFAQHTELKGLARDVGTLAVAAGCGVGTLALAQLQRYNIPEIFVFIEAVYIGLAAFYVGVSGLSVRALNKIKGKGKKDPI